MKFKIGTRGSQLALAQCDLLVKNLKQIFPDFEFEIVKIKTSGDLKQGTALAAQGDKKDWILQLELAVLDGSIDFALHSGKDVPCDIEAGTQLLSILQRHNPKDIFIGKLDPKTNQRKSFKTLTDNAKIGTASLRRKAQLLRHNPKFEIIDHRGNVPTRIQKLDQSAELDGIVLARAGVERLDLKIQFEEIDCILPAVNQGTLVVQFAKTEIKTILEQLIDSETQSCFEAERTCINILEGDCNSCIGCYATIDPSNHSKKLKLQVRVLSQDGQKFLQVESSAEINQAQILGSKLANELLELGARQILLNS